MKKISKTATQLEKMRQWTMKLAKLDMKGNLKPVKKDINKELGGNVPDVSVLHNFILCSNYSVPFPHPVKSRMEKGHG